VAGPVRLQKALTDRGRLREPELQLAHVAASHRLRKARDGRDAYLGLLGERANAGTRSARQIVEDQRGDLALGRTKLGRACGDARDDVEAQRFGAQVHCRVLEIARRPATTDPMSSSGVGTK